MADGPNKPEPPDPAPPGAIAGRRKRRVVIDSGGAPARATRASARDREAERAEGSRARSSPPTGPVTVPSGVTVNDLSQALGVPMPQIIKILMGLGEMVTDRRSRSPTRRSS